MNCKKCIHHNMCHLIWGTISKDVWKIINQNFKVECKHYKEEQNTEIDVNKMINKIETYMTEQLKNAEGVYK